MKQPAQIEFGKVAEVTFWFWVVKIAATTLGETAGDAVTMSMDLGYLVGTAIFAVVFIIAVAAQIRSNKFHPFLFWSVIVATTTAGTTLADLLDRSLGIGYLGGSTILLSLVVGTLALWHRALDPSPFRPSPRAKQRSLTGRPSCSRRRLGQPSEIGRLIRTSDWDSATKEEHSCSLRDWRWSR